MRLRYTAFAATLLAGSLLLTGCASGTAESMPTAVSASPAPDTQEPGAPGHTTISIPSTTARPADPPAPSDYDQVTNSQLTAQEASLNQLWALANSEVGADATPSVIPPTAGLVDFAGAVTARCYPIRTADEVAELEGLQAGFRDLLGTEAAFEPAQAYFERATELCM